MLRLMLGKSSKTCWICQPMLRSQTKKFACNSTAAPTYRLCWRPASVIAPCPFGGGPTGGSDLPPIGGDEIQGRSLVALVRAVVIRGDSAEALSNTSLFCLNKI